MSFLNLKYRFDSCRDYKKHRHTSDAFLAPIGPLPRKGGFPFLRTTKKIATMLIINIVAISDSARDESRTHTSQLTLAPETSASTISPPALGNGMQIYKLFQKIYDNASIMSDGKMKNRRPSSIFRPQVGQE